jgi:hypothetical protein
MSDLEVVSFRPEPGQYAWTFGGAAPVRRIRTPAVLEVFTEDCFGGRVRSEQDLVSQVCEFPFLNPQTGPLYLEVPSRGTRSRCTSFPSSRPGPGRRPRHGTGRKRTIVSGRSKGRPAGRYDIRQRAAIWPPPSSFSWPSSVGTERPDLDDHVS